MFCLSAGWAGGIIPEAAPFTFRPPPQTVDCVGSCCPSLATTGVGRRHQNAVGQHQQLSPCPQVVVVHHGRDRTAEGLAPKEASSRRDVSERAPSGVMGSSGVGSPWGTGRTAPPPKAARAAGWQVGCTPYRVETLRPHTEQRCRWWSRNHCGGTWPCRVPARWESTWEIKVCLLVHPWAPRHRAIESERSRRRWLARSPPSGVPGAGGPGLEASPTRHPRKGHPCHRGLRG